MQPGHDADRGRSGAGSRARARLPGRQPAPARSRRACRVEILTSAATKESDADVEALVGVLVAMGEPAVPHVAAGLADRRERVRLVAVEALGRIGGARAVDALLDALRDQSPVVRVEAVEQLGDLGDRRAVRPLLERYAKDPDPQVRYECLTSLGKIGDAAAADLLLAETRSADRYVRMWAMDALCRMNHADAPSLALSLLKDPDVYVRQQVLRSCGRAFDTPDGHRALIDVALHADAFEASAWARRYLHAWVEEGAGRSGLREEIRRAARAALGGPAWVRGAILLGDLADPDAREPLVRALGDPDPLVRHHAAYLLGRLRDRRAVPALATALRDPVPLVAVTARDALEGFARDGDGRAREALRRNSRPLSR